MTFTSPLTRTTNIIGLNQSILSHDNFADKLSIYTQSQIDISLNTQQNSLTAATSLLGNGSAIIDINYVYITTGAPGLGLHVLKAGDTASGTLNFGSRG